ncbi:integral membrane protein S linking to the trans Golgi network-domain-containing protein [Podospora fimiseda]|uniref:Integral membrane protein S linking to the trans Golgi network-domain-containing protein n=1 Tax=Podospora fimiseda TaxID=252190 RepID=A0AAN7BNN7_9PEZI|nr:integral membrane protein S linking to the trans Golgi network-domain-containing protein [Podospora fimiseda]
MARRRRPPRPGALSELPPLKILSQILALQALYYLFAFILLLFTSLASGTPFTLDLVFGWSQVRGDTTQGWLLGFIWVLDGGLLIALSIIQLISRSKLVPDFVLSLHFIHLVITYLYTSSVPQHSAWWMTMFISSGVSIALSTWGCRKRELKPIAFGGHSTTSQQQAQEGGEQAGDEEQGFTRGRGRGRARGDEAGRGEYEMVNVGTEENRRVD